MRLRHFPQHPHLGDEGPVLVAHLAVEVLSPVVDVADKHLGVQHGRVAEVSAVAAAQQAPRQLALVHHGRHHEAGPFKGTPPELEALKFGHRIWLHLQIQGLDRD